MTKSPKKLPLKSKGAVDLLEEAAGLVRNSPPWALMSYYVGTMPFVLALLQFFARMAADAGAGETLVARSLGLAVLFLWMKCWQAVYAHHLRGVLLNLGSEPVRPLKLVVAQSLCQPWYFLAMPVALVLTIPFGWCSALFQNITALGWGDESGSLFARAHRQAMLFPAQNFVIILVFLAFGCVVFVNLCALALILPHILKTLTGIESVFTRGAAFMLNSTFLLSMLSLTYLLVDPFRKAAYVLRCFYGDSLESGADLLTELRSLRRTMGKALPLLLFLSLLAAPVAQASDKNGSAGVREQRASGIDAASLNRAIDDVMARPEFAWRPLKAERTAKPVQGDGFFSRIAVSLRDWGRAVGRWLADAWDWLWKKFAKDKREAGKPVGRDHGAAFAAMYLLLAAVACLLAVGLWRRLRKGGERGEGGAAPEAKPVPDLNDTAVTADDLPQDRWEQLGRQLLASGDTRLALRAFYFAGISFLAGRGLLVLDRCKSDRDYERELARRAHSSPLLIESFAVNRLLFQGTWYGMHPVDEDKLASFMTSYRGIVSHGR